MIAIEPLLDSELLGQVTNLRHDLHANPELGYNEVRTSGKVREWLSELGVGFKADLAGGTGVLGFLPATENLGSAPTIALRADMDALPIKESTGRPYTSKNDGIMHACGHDGHTSILSGAAAVLSRTSERKNNVLFLFQPAEEGGAGGKRMVQEGALTGKIIGKPADMIYGLHGFGGLSVGQVATCDGAMLASADEFWIDVSGKGGHAAQPHTGIDPVVVAAQIVVSLQTIVSRNVDPLDSLVISVPMFHAGTAHNVIPHVAQLHGTLRTLRTETRSYAMRRIEEVITGIASAAGCIAALRYGDHGYPVTLNDPKSAARFRRLIGETEGVQLMPDTAPIMGAEDFSFYGESGVPACFYWLGLKKDESHIYPNFHTPEFDFNDDALRVGIKAMVKLALSDL